MDMIVLGVKLKGTKVEVKVVCMHERKNGTLIVTHYKALKFLPRRQTFFAARR